ncbi:MAG: hypothetical protein OSJ60_20340, partial [Lachnospiraceae bacterium]|nr:hypothetical protein [Lachnospiraceae bacterium]
MCYLIAKEFDKKGCIAVKTRHGKALADFTENLQKQMGENGVQLVTISRPSVLFGKLNDAFSVTLNVAI